MDKNHPSLIFYFIINIVIFTSCAEGSGYDGKRFSIADEKQSNGEKMSNDDANLWSREISFHQNHPLSSRQKMRRDSSPYSDERVNEQATNHRDDDDGGKDSMLDVANFRYILNHMQTTRDVNGQTTLTKPADTFNGKLIPCFIH